MGLGPHRTPRGGSAGLLPGEGEGTHASWPDSTKLDLRFQNKQANLTMNGVLLTITADVKTPTGVQTIT